MRDTLTTLKSARIIHQTVVSAHADADFQTSLNRSTRTAFRSPSTIVRRARVTTSSKATEDSNNNAESQDDHTLKAAATVETEKGNNNDEILQQGKIFNSD
jgi:hypothetical protein